ncbi:MAG TPA: hypothetical protein VH682_21175 [Gemmataceae bacterium]|jgi:hypothetical protein
MKRLSARNLTAGIVLLAAAASQARADYMNWTYSTDPSVPGIAVNAQSPSGGATVQLTDFTNGSAGAKIPIIAYTTNTSSTTPITFDPHTATYSLPLTFTDSTTHDSGTLTFSGSIGGTLSASQSTLVNTLSPSSSSLTLDGHVYTVSIPSVTLGPPSSPQQNILANVTVSNGPTNPPPPPPQPPTNPGGNSGGSNPGGGVQGAPEPTSLVLGGLGWSLLGAGCWWKRSRRSSPRES